ncbi:hypothetical protein H4S02_003559 [Coemansia sp. RSA 2611]|nr:hypothetical protein IWW54_003324 [Coemansia sp. RSA 2705]KAJ2387046.1 hypothetical protein H4S02_003559 [Coemansia sp. RSA 2611]KAJ2732221.1 hypothetical protein H4R23_002887 [Coemansia sp. Cherry 401B]
MEAARDYVAIASDVAASLKRLPAGHDFTVRVLHTVDYPVVSLTPRRSYSHFHAENTFARRILILVSQDDCLVAGLEAREFTSLALEVDGARVPQQTIAVNACIEKVDTSGALRMRGPLVRMLVAGYACSLQRYSKALDIASVGLHLFARAQPEYLFARSKENTGKHVLGDSALIKWWQHTLQSALLYAMANRSRGHSSADDSVGTDAVISDTAIAYCVIPGADVKDAPVTLGIQHDSTNGCHSALPAVDWKWGLPHPSEARAHNCVLQFPDDPITRLLAETHAQNWTVALLLEMLAVSEECGSGHRAAYFSAALPIATASPQDSPGTEETADQGTLSYEDYDQVLVKLFDRQMDFSTSDAALASSKLFVDFVDSEFDIAPLVVSTSGPAVAPNTPATTPAVAAPVNDLSSMIRKKRRVAQ